ncbi:flagellar basal body P-ring formation chaperone FlgA [Arenibaculum sp.]|uniref:flagellar basal body P-ring formation chaperone FlgA n=1 Tax=Arenibaculum sp. TaxID=2865862 RepID=UPI002E16083E|nr:flagellar basal body P-ring formation chaperone FlgA [Arenibaculum sp.]
MKQILVMVTAAVLFVFAVTAQAATLRSDAGIESDRITVGDIFDGAGAAADRVVGPAPEPGRRAVYDAVYLSRIARSVGLDWRPATARDAIVLTRASTAIRAVDVQIAVAEALSERTSEGRIEVELDNRLLEVHVEAGSDPRLHVETLSYDEMQGRFAATVVAGLRDRELRIPVTGRATAVIEVPVLNRSVRAGETIGEGDVAWTELRRARGNEDVVRAAADLVGMAPRRTLPPNTPVRSRDLREPSLVNRGALVTIVLESRSMVLTAQGRVLQDGAAGDVVRVVNTMSNRTIEATVTGPDLVAVTRPGAVAQF